MAVRIKSERIHRMAKELAAMTGETQVAAICRALEEKLAEIRQLKGECSAARPVVLKSDSGSVS